MPNSCTTIGEITDVNDSERNNSLGCFIKEYSFDNDTLTMHNNTVNDQGHNEIGDSLLHDGYIKKYHTKNGNGSADRLKHKNSPYNYFNKMYVSMRVGDYNGDGIDDLAVLSTPFTEAVDLDYLAPQLKIKYGTGTEYN